MTTAECTPTAEFPTRRTGWPSTAGTNAGCDSVGSGGHVHAVDCDVRVPALGLDRAKQVFYQGFTSLTEYANMCDARAGTLAVAGTARSAINRAWAAVGVTPRLHPGHPAAAAVRR